jgi:hypothetical protein
VPLTAEQQRAAAVRVAAWRADPQRPVACPGCDAEGLEIVDRSARPHAEWYVLTCNACGLNETLHIALGATPPGLD